ncbi:MAG: proton-conducting transporter membrane subunit, partial [Candidatus Margulisiibacteriota bacterium]
MEILLRLIFIPIAAAILCFIFKRAAAYIALATSAGILYYAGTLFYYHTLSPLFIDFSSATLSSGIFLAVAAFTFLIVLYSLKFMQGKERLGEYYAYVLITLSASAGVLFAADFLTLLFFWGIIGVTLYMLIGIGGAGATDAAKKSFLIVGGSDVLMVLGVALIWVMTKSLQIGFVQIPLDEPLSIAAFACLAIGAFAKAGVMPFHSWIPGSAKEAPVPVMAFLPASLDKLLGIYLLTKLCVDVFSIDPGSSASNILMAIGAITIICAVMGALVQHNMKKLLSFHAVSQVGYMVMGIGTGLPIGVAGAVFHMLNHAIYKSCLFLCAGGVEQKCGTTEIENLGGLAKKMPITFAAFLIAALSISGIPPLNGFVSKWMIYQSLIDTSRINPYWILWLAAALFGSALTLASFVKLIHAVFLGQKGSATEKASEVSWQMAVPVAALASLCLIFGIFAYTLPIKQFIIPSIEEFYYSGIWQPALATGMILAGLFPDGIEYMFFRV